MTAYLCRGWKRTGKDTLYEILIGSIKHLNWEVYSSKEESIFNFDNGIKISLAEKIKLHTHAYLELEDFGDCYTYEDIKDKVAVTNLIKSKNNKCYNINYIELYKYLPKDNNATLRDWYIAIGKAYIEIENKYYWCDKSIEDINLKNNIYVSDYRFLHEKEYFKDKYTNIKTIHIFRSEIPEPDKNIYSEHALDDELSDYLLVSSIEEFNIAIKRFPQYKDYTYKGKI